MPLYKAEGIVLRRRVLGESDLVVTLLSRDGGKLDAVARGARKPGSRLGGRLEIFSEVSLLIARGRTLDVISDVELTNPHTRVRGELNLFSHGVYLLDLFDAFVEAGGEPNHQYYFSLKYALEALDRGYSSGLVLRKVQMALSSSLGYTPQLEHCVECRGRLSLTYFSPSLGGVICGECGPLPADSLKILPATLQLWKNMGSLSLSALRESAIPPDRLADLASLLEKHLEYRAPRKIKSLYFLSILNGVGKMRIMGLDVGDRRIGIALSDPLGMTAQPLVTLRRDRNTFVGLLHLLKQHEVDRVVIGLPKNLAGEIGPQAEKVLAFVKEFQNSTEVPIDTVDERFSTAEARKMLIEADVGRSGRKAVIDKISAALILDGYLTRHGQGGHE